MKLNVMRPFLFSVLAGSLLACSNEPFRVDLTGIMVDPVKIERFDRELFSLDTASLDAGIDEMKKKYGYFFSGFARQIVYNRGAEDSLFPYTLRRFITDESMRQIYDETQKVFPDLTGFENSITDVYKRCKYYFPDSPRLKVVACVTGLNLPMSVSDSIIGIGLDMYLGSGSKIYELAGLEMYRRKVMNPYNVLPDFIKAWGMVTFERKENTRDLLTEMIYQGKLLYLTDALSPDLADSVKIGFSAAQLEWCTRNEGNMWSYLVKDEALFSTEDKKINQFTGEGPFTSGFNKESPAKTGSWIGWMIVRKYMSENPGTTLSQLMNEHDYHRILKESHYKPD